MRKPGSVISALFFAAMGHGEVDHAVLIEKTHLTKSVFAFGKPKFY